MSLEQFCCINRYLCPLSDAYLLSDSWKTCVSRLRVGPEDRGSIPGGMEIRLSYTVSRSVLGFHLPPIQSVLGNLAPGIKRFGREANHSPIFSVWSCTSTSHHVFMRWCLIKHRGLYLDTVSARSADGPQGQDTLKSATAPAILTEIFRGSSQTLHTDAGIFLRLGHDRLLPNSFQFVIHHLYYHLTLYI
jgi:hypothetical protein